MAHRLRTLAPLTMSSDTLGKGLGLLRMNTAGSEASLDEKIQAGLNHMHVGCFFKQVKICRPTMHAGEAEEDCQNAGSGG